MNTASSEPRPKRTKPSRRSPAGGRRPARADTAKAQALTRILERLGRVVIAYSGGVDSTFLLAEALAVLGPDNVLAVTADSATSAREELAAARAIARGLKAPHLVVTTGEFGNEDFRRNVPERCYLCKHIRFSALLELARSRGYAHVADGTNADDLDDYRPGMRAVKELGVRSPLLEAGFTKEDIRRASRRRGLPGWQRPPAACLASRCPYGEALTPEKLAMIDAAERYLAAKGFSPCRVRTHDLGGGRFMARIEVPRAHMAAHLFPQVRRRLQRLGYTYVTLDLAGYRTGSLNALLEPAALAGGGRKRR